MDGNVGQFYSANLGLVHTVARRGFGRLQAIGASIDYEDLVQDMSMVFIRSFELFDPEKGKFSTYYMQAAFYKLNKIAEKFEDERITNGVRSFEELSSRSGDDDFDMLNAMPSDSETPEEQLIGDRTAESAVQIIENASPLARLMAEWMLNTPPEVEREFEARRSHALLSRSLGVERRCAESITIGFVCDMLQLTGKFSQSSIKNARQELESKMRRVLK